MVARIALPVIGVEWEALPAESEFQLNELDPDYGLSGLVPLTAVSFDELLVLPPEKNAASQLLPEDVRQFLCNCKYRLSIDPVFL